MNRLSGKVALITGAGSGIGRAVASLFAKEGAKVAAVDLNPAAGQETVDIIRRERGEAILIPGDVTVAADAERIAKTTVNTYGKIDILHNNVGFWLPSGDNVTDLPEETWDKLISVNLKSVFLVSKFVIPEMIKRRSGVVINTSSDCGLAGYPDAEAYCAAKGGVVLLTKAMALDYARFNIRVNCVVPSNTRTPQLERDLAAVKNLEQAMKRTIPLGRLCEPSETAYAVLYLASDESSFTTGSCLLVDGGVMAGGTHALAMAGSGGN